MSQRSFGLILMCSLSMSPQLLVADVQTDIAERKSVEHRLDRKLPEINFKDNRLSDVIDFLRDVTGAVIFTDWRELELVGISKETKLTVQLNDVKFDRALRMILDRLGGGKMTVDYEIDEGKITISTAENLRTHTLGTKTYDVRNLLKMGKNAPTPAAATDRQERIKTLFELLTGTVDPESWRDNGGKIGSMKEMNGQLIVTQTIKNQKVIENFLKLADKMIGFKASE